MVDSIGPGANPVPVPNERAGQAPVGRVGAEVAVVPGQDPGEQVLTFTTGVGDASVPVLALPRNMDADVMMTLLYAVQEKQGQDQIKTAVRDRYLFGHSADT